MTEKKNPIPATRRHHDELEKKVIETLKPKNISVHKPSYPDLLVYNKKTGHFCFVEVKRRNDRPSGVQNWTFDILRKLGLPVIVVKPDDPFVEDEDFTVGERFISTVLRAMRKCEH